jgi:hypothetical protein
MLMKSLTPLARIAVTSVVVIAITSIVLYKSGGWRAFVGSPSSTQSQADFKLINQTQRFTATQFVDEKRFDSQRCSKHIPIKPSR